ncbi:LysR family transcriptional regulator [Allorhodopirellula heiligendammensis]|uniref:HTH-type transcriptional regulator CysB n=1 Tax=Allorhodopirellula heiligendammensis TaxID=2714739 RepID=A0A5C6BFQ6_9BACT|nr:LysR family transcriptional regulator [Allorhodopirellula heiligendammensis]TWU10477.1 HTH-type transcriptional regulator CysB [Allorhodopirellula heiligendammensis]
MTTKRRYYKQIRIAQFRAIVELAKGDGFAATAEVLELSTPSVWQQVRALEQEFGIALVEVNRQEVTLTKDGKQFVQLARPILEGFDSILEQFKGRASLAAQRLTIASPANKLIYDLMESIREYNFQFPNVELNFIDVDSNRARKMLEEGDVDLAIAGTLETSFPKSLNVDHLASVPFTMVSPDDHPILDEVKITPEALVRYPLVMYHAGSNTRTRVDQVFESAGLLADVRNVCETNTKELMLQFVRFGIGIAIVPLNRRQITLFNAERGVQKKLGFRSLKTVFGEEKLVILSRRNRREPAHQSAFRQCVLALASH